MRFYLWSIVGICCILRAAQGQAEYILNPENKLKIGVGGYVRLYSGKLESYQYNSVIKAQPVVTAHYEATEDLSVRGKVAYRWVRNDRFTSKKVSRLYDVFGTLDSKKYGKLDIGKLLNIAYLMHQGSVDVSCLDVDDSDISYFYQVPPGFYAPTLTYIGTDSREPKITYTTPDFNGFKAGLTVVRSENIKPDSIAPNGVKMNHGRGIIGAAQYKHHFTNDFWTAFSAGSAFYKDNHFFTSQRQVSANQREYSLGSKIGYKGLTTGVSYRRLLFSDAVKIKDSSAVSMGVAYQVNKSYALSLSWLHSQAKFIEKDKYNHIMFSNRYTFNSIVEGYLSVGEVDFISNVNGNHKSLFGLMGIQLKI